MSNVDDVISQLVMVAISGRYFTDASSKRYVQSHVPLWCDWCQAEPLKACIGARGMDLCLPCAGTLLKLNDYASSTFAKK